jgi:DNA polymerase-4
MIEEKGLTLVGVSVGNLGADQAVQLALPFDHQSDVMLDAALDAVRVRFGSNVLKRAVLMRQDLDLRMPMLPD